MKVIIAGSRTEYWWLYKAVNSAINHCPFKSEITEVVCGGTKGVDTAGRIYAKINNLPVKMFPANWMLGKQAGFLRNFSMAKYADALIAVWDEESRGTKHMIETAIKKGLKVYIYSLKELINLYENQKY